MSWMMLLAATAGAAGAAEMTLTVHDAPVRYYAEVLVRPAATVWYVSTKNLEAAPFQIMLSVEMTCEEAVRGKGVMMRCEIDNAQIQGESIRDNQQEALDGIHQEYTQLLSDARVEVTFKSDGRINLVDLENVPKDNERGRVVHENLRQLMRRVFAPLDLQLPRKGSVATGDTWKHKSGSMTMELLNSTATIGGTVLKYEAGPIDQVVPVIGEGYGTVGAGSTVGFALGGESGLRGDNASMTVENLYQMNVALSARYDTTNKQWIYAEYSAQGSHNRAAEGAPNKNYLQASWIGRINSDGTIEGPEGPRTLGAPAQ
ncbi:MAG: hypothetical protein AAFV53_34575 [Myxococcota bacterium]